MPRSRPWAPTTFFRLDTDAVRAELGELLGAWLHLFVEEQRRLPGSGPLGDDLCVVNREGARGQDTEPPAVELVAVAVGAVKDGLAPALGEPGNRRWLVNDARCDDQPAGLPLAGSRIDDEAARRCAQRDHQLVAPGHRWIDEHLRLALGRDLAWRRAIVAEKAVRERDKAVPALARIEHFDRPVPRSTAGAMTPARATFSSPR